MEKSKRIEAGVNGEIPLPEPIIQHIQSFLDAKQSAQTTVLSKSWLNAWLTNPILDFDQPNFQIADGFSEFATKAMQRYHESNHKIDKFRIWMKSSEGGRNPLANDLILKSLKMGVNDLNFEIHPAAEIFELPSEVLEAETLIRLSLIGCKIDRPVDGNVSCSKLKSLSLHRVYVGNDVIWDILSSCPLIEKLSLSECKYVIDITTDIVSRRMIKMLPLRCPTMNSFEFRNLKSLLLDRIDIDGLFTREFCHKLPCLVDLTLSRCYSYRRIQISSPSLECISMERMKLFHAGFDVPNIHNFKFSGSTFPFLFFSTISSREWLSEILIKCSCRHLGGSWFTKLKRFLTRFRESKVSLTISFLSEMNIYEVGDTGGLSSRPVVENLMLSVHSLSSVCSVLLNGLFLSFRPMVITLYWFPRSYIEEKANNKLVELICNTLTQDVSQVSWINREQNLFVMRDLEEVKVGICQETVKEWVPLHWKKFLDASAKLEYKQKICFKLRWGKETIA